MADAFLGDRRKALEESFFAKENARLIERMRSGSRDEETTARLMEITCIDDRALIDKLVALGIETDTWAAISLVPLVEIAWADGRVDGKEKLAVLAAAEANGIVPGSPSHDLLEGWLARRPDGRLMEVWGHYVVDLCATLVEAEKAAVKERVVGRARRVAEAAGGFLGLGSKISSEEEVVLAELAKAFD
jgi:hypothetical protein